MEKSTDRQSQGFTGGFRSHYVLAVVFLIYVSDYADRYVVAGMLNYIKSDWGISDTQAGMLMSVVLFTITALVIPSSLVIDKWSRRKMVAIMVGLWSLATLGCRFATGFGQLLVARIFIGVGEAGYAPAGTALLAAAYPEEKRARMMGIWNISIPLGMGIGLAGGGLIAEHYGWRNAFGIMAVPGFILAVMAWFMPDYKTVEPSPLKALPDGRFEDYVDQFFRETGGLFKKRALVYTYLGFAMNVSCTTAVAFWLAAYLERTHIVAEGRGGARATLIMALVLIGAPLGGFLADIWRKTRPNARLLLPSLTSLVAAGCLLLAFLLPGLASKYLFLVLYGVSVTLFIAPAAAVTQDLVHPGLRAFSYALCVLVQHILGDVWSPAIVGGLSDFFGDLSRAMVFIPAWGVLAALFFFLASRHYEHDLKTVERVELEVE